MNFTREPIIETVITPREGCKLVVRSSKGAGHEDYYVDAIEVVSFGNSIFYRSTERPKSFLLPVSDYEILELKETRMVLKSIGIEKNIKIGGGRQEKAAAPEEEREAPQEKAPSGEQQQQQQESRGKRDKRRSRRRRGMENKETASSAEPVSSPKEEGAKAEATTTPTTPISRLFPPPPTLIKEKLSRYKDVGVLEANIIPEKGETPPDVLEYGKDFNEESKDEILPEDLEPRSKGPRDEPVYNPEYYEEEHPAKVKEELPPEE